MKFTAKAELVTTAPSSKLWDALTKPELVKQYLFGTEMTTTWKIGSPITYRGVWQGKTYEDKGTVVQFEPGKLIVSTYWSSFSGLPDLPENYQTVTYQLTPEGNGTRLTILQEGNKSEESAKHSESNWQMVLDKIRELIES